MQRASEIGISLDLKNLLYCLLVLNELTVLPSLLKDSLSLLFLKKLPAMMALAWRYEMKKAPKDVQDRRGRPACGHHRMMSILRRGRVSRKSLASLMVYQARVHGTWW